MARWPPLQELYTSISFVLHAQHRAVRVERIELTGTMQYRRLLAMRGPLDTLLHAASPVRLSLTILTGPDVMNTLSSVLQDLPRLRTLSLRMIERLWNDTDTTPEEQWLVNNVRLLGGLRLASLRLIINCMDLASFGSPTPSQPERGQRTAAADPLPVQLVQAIPMLRLLGVTSQHWTTTDATPPAQDAPSEVADKWCTRLWDRLVTHGRYHRRWWCTGEGGAGLTEVSSKKAEEMMRDLEYSVTSGTSGLSPAPE